MYLKRIIEEKIKDYLKIYGAIYIQGPRACGKTTTSKLFSKSNIILKKDPILLDKLANNYDLVLEGAKPKLIDEWQLLPSLWDYVKVEVDEQKKKGLYILCGSSAPEYEADRHSGAMRIGRIKMTTLTISEKKDTTKEVNFYDLISKKEEKITGNKPYQFSKYLKHILQGGWPSLIGLQQQLINTVLADYLENIADVDMRNIAHRPSKERTLALISALAKNVSSNITFEKLSKEAKIIDSTKTVRNYLDLFNRIFLIFELPAWKQYARSSVQAKTNPKYYFSDVSLACNCLHLSEEKLNEEKDILGMLFENLAIHDLMVYADLYNGKCFYYRDNSQLEVDLIIEMPNGEWSAFEIKLGSKTGIDDAVNSLKRLKQKISLAKWEKLISLNIITAGETSYTREDGINVVALGHLYC